MALWQQISIWCKVTPIFAFEVRDLLELFKVHPVKESHKKVFHSIIITACWCLWKLRNEVVFNG
ncbi:hypothetical protein R6Q59_011273 [Mikania micrantha]